jgi:hypothetical protein
MILLVWVTTTEVPYLEAINPELLGVIICSIFLGRTLSKVVT